MVIPMRVSPLVSILAPCLGRPRKVSASRFTHYAGRPRKQLSECNRLAAPCDSLRACLAERSTRSWSANITGASSGGSGVSSESSIASYANPSGFLTPEIWRRGSQAPVPPVAYRCLPPPGRQQVRPLPLTIEMAYLVVRSLCRRPHLYAAPRHVGISLRAWDGDDVRFRPAEWGLCRILQTNFAEFSFHALR